MFWNYKEEKLAQPCKYGRKNSNIELYIVKEQIIAYELYLIYLCILGV